MKPKANRTEARIQRAFGERLRKARKGKGWSQEQFAEASSLHRTYISDIERGARNPSLVSLSRLAAALETTVSKLTQGIEDIQ